MVAWAPKSCADPLTVDPITRLSSSTAMARYVHQRRRWWRRTHVAELASVAGAACRYSPGHFVHIHVSCCRAYLAVHTYIHTYAGLRTCVQHDHGGVLERVSVVWKGLDSIMQSGNQDDAGCTWVREDICRMMFEWHKHLLRPFSFSLCPRCVLSLLSPCHTHR